MLGPNIANWCTSTLVSMFSLRIYICARSCKKGFIYFYLTNYLSILRNNRDMLNAYMLCAVYISFIRDPFLLCLAHFKTIIMVTRYCLLNTIWITHTQNTQNHKYKNPIEKYGDNCPHIFVFSTKYYVKFVFSNPREEWILSSCEDLFLIIVPQANSAKNISRNLLTMT